MSHPVAPLVLLALLSAGPALARDHGDLTINGFSCDEPVRWSQRHDTGEARFAITTEDGKVTLLLTDRVVAFQLSDRTMRKIDRKLHQARHEDDGDDDGPIGDAIKAAVLGAVQSFLDHSAECPVRELRDVRYANGRLEFVTRDGDRIFDHFDIDDEDVLESFDPRDAVAFVREFHRLRPASR